MATCSKSSRNLNASICARAHGILVPWSYWHCCSSMRIVKTENVADNASNNWSNNWMENASIALALVAAFLTAAFAAMNASPSFPTLKSARWFSWPPVSRGLVSNFGDVVGLMVSDHGWNSRKSWIEKRSHQVVELLASPAMRTIVNGSDLFSMCLFLLFNSGSVEKSVFIHSESKREQLTEDVRMDDPNSSSYKQTWTRPFGIYQNDNERDWWERHMTLLHFDMTTTDWDSGQSLESGFLTYCKNDRSIINQRIS